MMDLVLVIDVSGSIRRKTFDQVQVEIVKILENLEIASDRVSRHSHDKVVL